MGMGPLSRDVGLPGAEAQQGSSFLESSSLQGCLEMV